MILDAITYPFRGFGWAMILVGTVFSVILHFAMYMPIIGLAAALFSAGYFGAFYLEIVASTMTGDTTTPDWPTLTSIVDEILMPLGRLIGLLVMSFAPFVLVLIFLQESPWFLIAFLTALLYGCIYFPMSVLAAQALGGLFAALPHVVIPAIFKALPHYLVALIMLALVMVLVSMAQRYAGAVPLAGWFLSAALGLYGMMFQGRIIGLVYVKRHDRLGW